MGAQKPPPELGCGGSGFKIQYQIFDFHAISLDEMVIGARTLILPQELDLFRPQAPGAPGLSWFDRWMILGLSYLRDCFCYP